MEMAQLNEALVAAVAAASRQSQLTRRLEGIEKDLNRLRTEVARLETELTEEERDVLRLKQSSLVGLWYDLIGRRAEQIAKEEEEAAHAHLHFAEAEERLHTLEGERSELVATLGALGKAADQLEDLLAEKRRLIRVQYPEAADRLLDWDQEAHDLQRLQVELAEAKAAGSRAVAALEGMADALESAHRLGVWDTWTRGGILVDLAKHDRLDDAEDWAHEVQAALVAFQRELRDVDVAVQAPTIEIDGWDRGLDIFFDNIFTDWSILRKIEDAMERVEQAGFQLNDLADRLDRQAAQGETDLERVRSERERFLTDFGR
jgi:DNA repair exonuclease SbcCD ATPase subunit